MRYGLFSKSYVVQRAKHDLYPLPPRPGIVYLDVYVSTSALALIQFNWKSEMEPPLKHQTWFSFPPGSKLFSPCGQVAPQRP